MRAMDEVLENTREWKYIAQDAIESWFDEIDVEDTFTGEDIRLSIRSSIGEPHHYNAWSAVVGGRIRKWLKVEKIKIVASKLAVDPSSHGRGIRRYKKVS